MPAANASALACPAGHAHAPTPARSLWPDMRWRRAEHTQCSSRGAPQRAAPPAGRRSRCGAARHPPHAPATAPTSPLSAAGQGSRHACEGPWQGRAGRAVRSADGNWSSQAGRAPATLAAGGMREREGSAGGAARLRQARHEVQAPAGHARGVHRLHGAQRVGHVVGPSAEGQQLVLEGLQTRWMQVLGACTLSVCPWAGPWQAGAGALPVCSLPISCQFARPPASMLLMRQGGRCGGGARRTAPKVQSAAARRQRPPTPPHLNPHADARHTHAQVCPQPRRIKGARVGLNRHLGPRCQPKLLVQGCQQLLQQGQRDERGGACRGAGRQAKGESGAGHACRGGGPRGLARGGCLAVSKGIEDIQPRGKLGLALCRLEGEARPLAR